MLGQAESRAHRIGQTDDVKITYLHAQGTADDELWKMVINKQHILNGIGLDDEDLNDNFRAGNHLRDQSVETDEETDDDEEVFQPNISVRLQNFNS